MNINNELFHPHVHLIILNLLQVQVKTTRKVNKSKKRDNTRYTILTFFKKMYEKKTLSQF